LEKARKEERTADIKVAELKKEIEVFSRQIEEMRDRGQVKVIDAKVPLAEMFGYATELRSMSQGRASYNIEFDHYAIVPPNVAQTIIEARGAK